MAFFLSSYLATSVTTLHYHNTIVGFLKENLFAEFIFPAVGILDEFLCVRKLVITVKSGDVGGGLDKDVDKATIGSFNIRGQNGRRLQRLRYRGGKC